MPSPQSLEIDAFHAFERSGWESNVAEYDAAFGRLTTQAIGPLLDAVDLSDGACLLDVATGPGYVAAAAAARGAKVTGIDFSEPMIARASKLNPTIDFQVGDAEALSFSDASFDAAVMSFGILHLAQPELAMSEVARVLKPGGRFAFTAWAKPEEAVGFGIILTAIQTHGNPAVQLPKGPPFFRFSEPAECERTLREAGFSDVDVTSIPLVWRFSGPDELFAAIFNGGVRIRAVLRAQSDEALRAIRNAARDATNKYMRGSIVELSMPAVLATAVKMK